MMLQVTKLQITMMLQVTKLQITKLQLKII